MPREQARPQWARHASRLAFGLVRGAARAGERAIFAQQRALIAARYRASVLVAHSPRPDDTFITSYPKAGTTVMQMLLYQMTTNGSLAFQHIDHVVPWFDWAISLQPSRLDALPSPRLFKSHRTVGELPRGRYIYLVRNPKDSCVSYYHHAVSINGNLLSLPQYVDRFIARDARDHWFEQCWFDHLARSVRRLRAVPALIVGYDEMVADMPGTVERVARFCGISLSPAAQATIVHRCSIGFMRGMYQKFDPRYSKGLPRTDETPFIRRGEPGGWASELSPSLASRIDQRLEQVLPSIEPYLSPQLLERIRGPAPATKGTIAVVLGGTNRLWASDQGIMLQVSSVDPSVSVGDRVNVKVRAGSTAHLLPGQVITVAASGPMPHTTMLVGSVDSTHEVAISQLLTACREFDSSTTTTPL